MHSWRNYSHYHQPEVWFASFEANLEYQKTVLCVFL
jgi:hypothetical protein